MLLVVSEFLKVIRYDVSDGSSSGMMLRPSASLSRSVFIFPLISIGCCSYLGGSAGFGGVLDVDELAVPVGSFEVAVSSLNARQPAIANMILRVNTILPNI